VVRKPWHIESLDTVVLLLLECGSFAQHVVLAAKGGAGGISTCACCPLPLPLQQWKVLAAVSQRTHDLADILLHGSGQLRILLCGLVM